MLTLVHLEIYLTSNRFLYKLLDILSEQLLQLTLVLLEISLVLIIANLFKFPRNFPNRLETVILCLVNYFLVKMTN